MLHNILLIYTPVFIEHFVGGTISHVICYMLVNFCRELFYNNSSAKFVKVLTHKIFGSNHTDAIMADTLQYGGADSLD